eukprot:356523-Chlamydomonas_euryale.AAC.3
MLAAQALLDAPPPDPAGSHRVDLTHLHVYTIDDEVRVPMPPGSSHHINLTHLHAYTIDDEVWVADAPSSHPLLVTLYLTPVSPAGSGKWSDACSGGRRALSRWTTA